MRFLIAGDWHSDLHEHEVKRSLLRLGHEVDEFKWFQYFDPLLTGKDNAIGKSLLRIENKFVAGRAVLKLNRDFVDKVISCQPDVVFIYRGTHVYKEALDRIKEFLPEVILVGYNNDDPFSPIQPKYLWRHFIKSIPSYDLLLAYRHSNINSFYDAGAKRVELLRSWYVIDRSYHIDLNKSDKEKYSCDVVFVGHYEPDQRLEYLEEIIKQGFNLKLFGPTKYWSSPLSKSPLLKHLNPISPVWGEEYNKALSGAKIALCFLSKLNRDTYTRRCFEIPATKTLMLSEFTEDLATIYNEGCEAEYFRDKNEMITKIQFYCENEDKRIAVATNGYSKVVASGHDIDSRMKTLLSWISEVKCSGEVVVS